MKKAISIILACAVGAGIGTILALQYFGEFWILGVLIGGLIGYLAYDFKEVVQAISRAWREITNIKITRGDLLIFKDLLLIMTAIFYPFSFFCLAIFLFSGPSYIYGITCLMAISGIAMNVVVYLLAKEACFVMLTKSKIFFHRSVKIWFIIRICVKNSLASMILSPIISPFILAFAFLIAIFYFLSIILKLIHSDLRLLVGIDSLMGGFIGFHFQSPIIGIGIGALCGFLSYYVISPWVFKLKPTH